MREAVKVIPATISRMTAQPIQNPGNRKVAAYARVSSNHEEQKSSYAAQVDYYTRYIKGREDWDFVKVYTDEGISGLNTKNREGFKQMVSDALAGKIDLIVTKSVSRFARNTVDSLATIRKLKANHVECYFEKENIWTFDSKGELLLTIMSSIAQEESRSISENCTWGQRKRLADGKVSVGYKNFLGYDRGENGGMVINEAQARIVRRIYGLYLSGMSTYSIAKKLTEDGIPTPSGKRKWGSNTVASILRNEKYKGDALLQKEFTVDFLTKKKKKNEGEVAQYYVENDHPPIVSKEVFEAVQAEISKRRKGNGHRSGISILASKIICGDCGNFYGAKVWHSNDKYRRVVYRCNKKYDTGKKRCSTPTISEKDIERLFVDAINQLMDGREDIMENLINMRAMLRDNHDLEKSRDEALKQMRFIAGKMDAEVSENAHFNKDQIAYRERYAALELAYDKEKNRYESSQQSIADRLSRMEMLGLFIERLNGQKEKLREFNGSLWGSLLENVTIYSQKKVVFCFKDGTKITTAL